MTATAIPEPAPLQLAPPTPRHRRWLIGGCLAVGALAVLVVIWARTRPGFDPYGWLTWGNQTVFGTLDTNAAPSWKPLPFLFTTPFALAGHVQVYLWLWFSVAVSLSGNVFAYRIAHRLTLRGVGEHDDAPDLRRRRAAVAAGLFAAVVLLGMQDYLHYVLSAQSDTMIVALCLGAIDCALCGRHRTALTLAVLGGLGRPEVWPFLGLYGLWCWRAVPAMRWLLVAEAAVLLLLWFGIPALTSRSFFVAGDNALGSGRALHKNLIGGTIQRFLDLYPWPLEVTALLSVALAARRRDRAVLALTGIVVVWVVVEVAFALHGWPGLARYLLEPAGVTVVIAAVFVGRALAGDLAGAPRPSARLLGAGVALLATGALVPGAVSAVRFERTDLHAQRTRTNEINQLSSLIDSVGGAKTLHACGESLISLEWQSILAWRLHLNVARIGWKFPKAIASGRPIVLFSQRRDGIWHIRAVHQRAAGCLKLPS